MQDLEQRAYCVLFQTRKLRLFVVFRGDWGDGGIALDVGGVVTVIDKVGEVVVELILMHVIVWRIFAGVCVFWGSLRGETTVVSKKMAGGL